MAKQYTTKEERKAILKELGVTKEEMKQFWDECVKVNWKIRMLDEQGHTWKDLTASQMRQLPTLKETTLASLAKKEEEEKAAAEAAAKEKEDREYYENHFEELMVKKIEDGEALTEREMSNLVYEYGVSTEEGDDHRWVRDMSTIVELCGRYFEIDWYKGLTEMQENEFYDQPFEVEKREYEKTITVTEWVKVSKEKENSGIEKKTIEAKAHAQEDNEENLDEDNELDY